MSFSVAIGPPALLGPDRLRASITRDDLPSGRAVAAAVEDPAAAAAAGRSARLRKS
jgi:hypothetical protein